MKYTIIFICLILPIFALSQANKRIEGLGAFKMGARLDSISKTFDLSSYIIQKDDTYYRYSDCPHVKVFYLTDIDIASLRFQDFELKFWDDTLIYIQCNSTSDIENAISIKYGEPELRTETKNITCRYSYSGAEVQHEETSYYKTWRSDRILAFSALCVYYSDECEKKYLHYLNISLNSYTNKIYDCSLNARNEIKKAKDEELKKKLDGL